MKYFTLGFTIHKKCSASCKMCCFESTPKCKEKLDVDLIKKYILSTKENSELSTISFTGGEPFLEYDILKDLIAFTADNGKIPTCITNGYWASDYITTYEKLKELKSLGLKRLSLSYDNYHKEYVRIENIKNILNACKDLSIPAFLGMIRTKDENIGNLVDGLGDSLTNVNIQIFSCFPVGGAKKVFDESAYIRNIKSEHLDCPYNGYMVVSYDGKIYPCCSQLVVDTELSVGNYEDSRRCGES